jgi:choline-sulfatase
MRSVLDAGSTVRTNQLDYDDEVVFAAERKLYEIARDRDQRPFLMVVSLTHPHDPFAMPARWWERHGDAEIPMPRHTGSDAGSDPHARRVRAMCEIDLTPPSLAQVRAARRAYCAAIAYVDDQLGRLRQVLAAIGAAPETVILLTSDHGEMLGERGLWFKMTFFEWASRIPLVVHAPGRFAPHRMGAAVSAVDLLPTLLELAGLPPLPTPHEGRSLLPHLEGRDGHDEVLAEYTAEGALAPIVMIRRGRWKFVHSPSDPDQLFELVADPDELHNLAPDPGHAGMIEAFRAEVGQHWDLPQLDRAVRASQERRRFVFAANRSGRRPASWDFQPVTDASQHYVRSHMKLDDIEAAARFPRVRPAQDPAAREEPA